jgi:CTP:molybdopterin cytidylyltransferase MocA
MGRAKALLCLQGRTFLEHLLARFMSVGVSPLVVVLGSAAQEILSVVKLSPARIVVNPDPSRGQISSIKAGILALHADEVEAIFVAPVDTPRVKESTLLSMMEALSGHSLVVPLFAGRRGHPALFSASLFPALLGAPETRGARAVVHATPDRLELLCDDAGVLEDFDAPEDLPRS